MRENHQCLNENKMTFVISWTGLVHLISSPTLALIFLQMTRFCSLFMAGKKVTVYVNHIALSILLFLGT